MTSSSSINTSSALKEDDGNTLSDQNSFHTNRNTILNSDDNNNINLSNDDDRIPFSEYQQAANLGTLLDYLTENREDILTNQHKLRKFEEITQKVIETHNDPALLRIIKNHGWVGKRYIRVKHDQFDTDSYLRHLSNLYLSQVRQAGISKDLIPEVLSESENVLSFLPNILLKHLNYALQRERSPIDTSISCSSFLGAALLVDISGFSTFAATMCSKGVTGLSDLHDATNVFLGDLVNIVYRYGGDVVAFAGDALICIFLNQSSIERVNNNEDSRPDTSIGSYYREDSNSKVENLYNDSNTSDGWKSALKKSSNDYIKSSSSNSLDKLSNVQIYEKNPNDSPMTNSLSQSNISASPIKLIPTAVFAKKNQFQLLTTNREIYKVDETEEKSQSSRVFKSQDDEEIKSAHDTLSNSKTKSSSSDIDNPFTIETTGIINKALSNDERKSINAKVTYRSNSGNRKYDEDDVVDLPIRKKSTSAVNVSISNALTIPAIDIAATADISQPTNYSSNSDKSQTPNSNKRVNVNQQANDYKDPYLDVNCCLRALECAMVLRETTAKELCTHIAVSYGEMKLAILGGHNDDWVYLLNGKCISELSGCINVALKKQVVVTKKCYEEALNFTYSTSSSGANGQKFFNNVNTTTNPSAILGQTFNIYTENSPASIETPNKMSKLPIVVDEKLSPLSTIPEVHSTQFMSPIMSPAPDYSIPPDIYKNTTNEFIENALLDDTLYNFNTDSVESGRTTASIGSTNSGIAMLKKPIKENNDKNELPHPLTILTSPNVINSRRNSLTTNQPIPISNRSTNSSRSTSMRFSNYHPKMIVKHLEEELVLIENIESTIKPSDRELRLKRILIESPNTVIDTAKLFVSRPILSAIYSDSLDRTSELRQVVTMFVSLDSYSPDEHQNPLTLQPFFKVVQEALHQSGGFLRQFVVDDKGCVVIAMWGVPQFSYANNSLRGLFCGVAISKRTSTLGLKCSVGLTSGFCYCGSIGATIRRDYVIIGDQVNMAARLMGKAKGRVLLSDILKENLPVEMQLHLIRGEEMKVKGVDHMIKPYVYNGQEISQSVVNDEHEGQTTVLRRHVRILLSNQLDKISNTASAPADQARLTAVMSMKSIRSPDSNSRINVNISVTNHAIFTVIVGLPGTGKSTAAQYFEQEARKRNIECIKIQSRPGEESRPYSIIRKLFLELVGISIFREEGQQRQVIRQIIKDAYPYSNEEVKETAALTLEIILGLEWSHAFKSYQFGRDDDVSSSNLYGSSSNSSSSGSSSSASSSFNPTPEQSHYRSPTSDHKDTTSNQQPTQSLTTSISPTSLQNQNSIISNSSLQMSNKDSTPIHTRLPLQFSPSYVNNSSRSAISQSPTPKTKIKRKLKLKVGDKTFYYVMRSLLRKKKTVVIIEDADYCDELSWNEFHLMLLGDDIQLAMLLTMRTPPSIKHNSRVEVISEEPKQTLTHEPNRPTKQFSTKFISTMSTKIFNNDNQVNDSPTKPQLITITRASGEVVTNELDMSGVVLATTTQDIMNNMMNHASTSKYGIKFRPNNSYYSILSHPRCMVIEMNPLNEEEINELLIEALQIEEVPPDLVLSVLEVTNGNAFWCKAIARFIRENGIDEYSRTIVRRGGNNTSLRALILNRIDKLSSEQQTVAKLASIIGDEFSLNLLTVILSNKIGAHLTQSLEALQQNGLVYCVDESNEVIFSFQNQLIRNTIYDLTPPSDAAEIHLKIAQQIEFQFTDDLRGHYANLSYHFRFSQSRQPEAFKYTVKAADQAISKAGYTDGLSFLQIAKPLAASTEDLRTLVEVVKTAINDLTPHSYIRMGLRLIKGQTDKNAVHSANSANEARNALLTAYTRFLQELQKTIDLKLSEAIRLSASGSNAASSANTPQISVRQSHARPIRVIPNPSSETPIVPNPNDPHNRPGPGRLTVDVSYVQQRQREVQKSTCCSIQ